MSCRVGMYSTAQTVELFLMDAGAASWAARNAPSVAACVDSLENNTLTVSGGTASELHVSMCMCHTYHFVLVLCWYRVSTCWLQWSTETSWIFCCQ